MRPFLHERQHRIEELLSRSGAALHAYVAADFGLDDLVTKFLDEAVTGYRDLGSTEAENEMLALRAQFASARGGVHPLTLERVTRRRREMERSIALRVLLASAERLRADCARIRESLTQTRDLLLPIVGYALQKGLVPPGHGPEYTQSELEGIWHAILADPDLRVAARQVALGTHQADVLLLLADLLSAIVE